MIKRMLLKELVQTETSQRRALFRINCKRKGKICKVVIDSGSTDNMVSREMVDKLNIERIPHKTHYRTSWVSDS